jgi:hypothetical protein
MHSHIPLFKQRESGCDSDFTLPQLHQSLEFTYHKTYHKPKITVTEEVVTDSSGIMACVMITMVKVWLWAC